ncbi:MAG: hypothetical protein DWQ01_07230 [Planctomycetota bacterium]|nr:MAG: hypothetical protein DWQ01_07230 [Planctomycetota bacterium]
MPISREVRSALPDWLDTEAANAFRARLVRSETEVADGQAGLTVDIEAGSLLLRRGDVRYRVVFEGEASAASLAPGRYQLLGYRVRKTDESGSDWFISTTGASGPELLLRAGTTHNLEVDPGLDVKLSGSRKGIGPVNLRLSVTGDDGRLLTLYREGKRVSAEALLIDGEGRELARSGLEYG